MSRKIRSHMAQPKIKRMSRKRNAAENRALAELPSAKIWKPELPNRTLTNHTLKDHQVTQVLLLLNYFIETKRKKSDTVLEQELHHFLDDAIHLSLDTHNFPHAASSGSAAMADVVLSDEERARYEWELFGPDEDVACGSAAMADVELDVEAVAVDKDSTFTHADIHGVLESTGYQTNPGNVGYIHGLLESLGWHTNPGGVGYWTWTQRCEPLDPEV